MNLKCLSCGASNEVLESEEVVTCSFCGSLIEKMSFAKEEKKAIVKCDTSNRVAIYNNRNIDTIIEVVDLHSDIEIENLKTLHLKGNRIRTLRGISKFNVSNLDLSDNDLIDIDEFPTFKRNVNNSFFIYLRNNYNLTNISKDVIKYLNNLQITRLELHLLGCAKFNYEVFCKLDYSNLNYYILIEPSQDILLPDCLKNLGFVQLISEYDEEGYYISEIEKRKIVNWIKKPINDEITQLLKNIEYNNSTLYELNKKKCFIATATMGNYNHPVVIDLRLFRDNWLLKRKWGVNFTNWYISMDLRRQI